MRRFVISLICALALMLACLAYQPLRVSAAQTRSDGPIKFRVRAYPLSIKARAPRLGRRGRVFTVKAEITDNGPFPVKGVRARIFASKGLTALGTTPRRYLGYFARGQVKTVYWSVKAGSTGKRSVKIRVTGLEKVTGRAVYAKKRRFIYIRRLSVLSTQSSLLSRLKRLWF